MSKIVDPKYVYVEDCVKDITIDNIHSNIEKLNIPTDYTIYILFDKIHEWFNLSPLNGLEYEECDDMNFKIDNIVLVYYYDTKTIQLDFSANTKSKSNNFLVKCKKYEFERFVNTFFDLYKVYKFLFPNAIDNTKRIWDDYQPKPKKILLSEINI
jgi:hypothetical protein